jgi:hypothetical protein
VLLTKDVELLLVEVELLVVEVIWRMVVVADVEDEVVNDEEVVVFGELNA